MKKIGISKMVGVAALLGLTAILSGCDDGGNSSPTPTDPPPVDPPPSGSFTVGGSIAGNDASVILSLNGVEESFAGSDFTFTSALDEDDAYAVAFTSTTSNQVCVVTNGGGIITANVTNVAVTCSGAITELIYDDAEVTGSFAGAGDFNGDGMSDLAIGIRTMPSHNLGADNHMIRYVFGTGNGGFNGMIDIASPIGFTGSTGQHPIASDWNNDGFDDFTFSGLEIQSYAGNNTNTPTMYFTSSERAGHLIHSVDIDGDGYEDILSNVIGSNFQHFAIYTNDGAGSFEAPEYFGYWLFDSDPTTPSVYQVYNFAVNDFDGDGRKDVVAYIADVTDGEFVYGMVFYRGNSANNFDMPTTVNVMDNAIFLGNTFPIIEAMISGDFDGDGDIDIAITSTTNYLQVMLNNGSGQFTEGQKVIVGTEPVDLLSADFNNDGMLDLVSGNYTSRNVIISYGNGDGTFGDSTGSAASWLNIQLDNLVDIIDLDIADFDGDSYLDIVVSETGSYPYGSIQILRSPGQ